METKEESLSHSGDLRSISHMTNQDMEYASIYCFNIMSWNIKHCPFTAVMIDDIRCFDMKGKGNVSVCYNMKKNELKFTLNILKDNVYQQIIKKEKIDLFTVENFKKHFTSFYISISEFVILKPVEYCNDCSEPTYRLSNSVCNNCYIRRLKKVNCNKCTENRINIQTQKQSKFKRFFLWCK